MHRWIAPLALLLALSCLAACSDEGSPVGQTAANNAAENNAASNNADNNGSDGNNAENNAGNNADENNVTDPDVGVDAAEDTGGMDVPPGDDTGGEDVSADDTGGGDDTGEDEQPDVPPPTDPPPPPAYSNGTCPVITSGPTSEEAVNMGFPSSDRLREFRMIVPPSYDGSEPWPLMFAWHWLNASSNSFVREGELESAAEQLGFLIVLPDKLKKANGDKEYVFDWPFAEVWGAEPELVFFDDLLACVTEQYNVDLRRVYGIGVSAGALWLTYLSTTPRVNHLAAVESLSGGLGDVLNTWRMEYAPQPHKFPAIVLWGGPTDWLGVDFAAASMRYRDALINDNHFVVECVHSSGHAVPPIEPPSPDVTKFISLWQFMLDHPWGQAPATSPWQQTGMPAVMPDWCRIATP